MVVAFDDHDPTASVDTFGRRIWGGAMRPPLTPLRFRFAGGRAGPFSKAAADGSAGGAGAGAGTGAGAGGIASSPLPSSSEELP